MAQMVLGGLGGMVGGGVGRVLGAAVGGMLDRALVAGLTPARQRGPRLEALKIQSSAVGAPMAWAAGRARVAGQLIWAARFLEHRRSQSAGKGGPRTVDHAYSLSFAVALCEGEIDGVGRVWADGAPLDLSGVTVRVHRGGEDQVPDPLIEAIEGSAPAYRGVAYAVFEDLPLGPFGNRPPQLAFEVFRRPRGSEPALEDRIEGVCLIPGAGEFVLAAEPVTRRQGLTRSTPENVGSAEGRPDFLTSLDQLMAHCPNLKRVSLVVGWFGDDLRADRCRVKPGVERRDKPTEPLTWSVAGLDRAAAHLVSQAGAGPAYGGTPSDESVRQAVAALKSRGLEVTLYPFVFMDIPADNDLPDPYGGARQAAYPWRGRVRGRDGADAAADVAALFGAADGWGLRRMALHYAGLAAATGADGLLIGSEMRGLTWTRDASGGFPAVGRLRALAAECRAITGPGVRLSYAADWTEYAGFQQGADRVFHLDPLWADPAVDYVGIDWYPPLGDWRAGDGGADAAMGYGPDDPAYLAANLRGGEGFDWYYADEAARAAQVRTPIVDTAHGEDWAFRPKDLAGWWSNAHHDRINGVRSAAPTAWTPGIKPVRLTEFGCAAVDRGGNAPNRFLDPKSAESALPPASTGARDDRTQRRALEALLSLADPPGNPVSGVYGGPMLEAMDAWCWDARPFPAFPARDDLWADAGAWRTGHWLNGRLGGETRDLIAALLRRAGLDDDAFEVGAITGPISGYVVDRPMRVRDALEPLVEALGLTVAEQDGRVVVREGADGEVLALEADRLAFPEEGHSITRMRSLDPPPRAARVRHIDEAGDYQTGSAVVRGPDGGDDLDLDLPAVCGPGTALAAARRLLAGPAPRITVALGPVEALRLEPGDMAALEGEAGVWRVEGVALDETPTATLSPVRESGWTDQAEIWRMGRAADTPGRPFFRLLELPAAPGGEDDPRPFAAVASDPWRPAAVHAGEGPAALSVRGRVDSPATVGRLVAPLAPGVRHRLDRRNAMVVEIEGAAPASVGAGALSADANSVAVETAAGWEVLQFATAEAVGAGLWRLSGLIRAQRGGVDEMDAGAAAGAPVIFLDGLARVEAGAAERGLPLIWRAGPAGAAPGGGRFAEVAATLTGLHERVPDPAHLRVAPEDGGLRLSWIPRDAADADGWGVDDGRPASRWRVRILDGEVEKRVLESDLAAVIYAAGSLAEDFPGGLAGGRFAVSGWSDGYGWGVEASRAF